MIENHKSLLSFHNPHRAVFILLFRQSLQLHGSASVPWRDGAPGRRTLPRTGAQQPTPLCEKLLLPQEWHLHTVSHCHCKGNNQPWCSADWCIHFLHAKASPLRHIVNLDFLLLFRPLLLILTGINNVVLRFPLFPHNRLSVLRGEIEPGRAQLLIRASFRSPRLYSVFVWSNNL